jgi:hypothetical protein
MLGIREVREAPMRRTLCIAVIGALFLILLTLAACVAQPDPSPAPFVVMALNSPVGPGDQATQDARLTQDKINADIQAAATAEIVHANAQATLNSADATLNAAQIQQQNSADVLAAQIAAAAEIVRANAQATLNAANSTQSAALIQDAIRQTQVQYNLQVEEAAGTQRAEVANNIATQTRAAAATAQWYADQSRQRTEQRQVPITFLWMWCFPVFVVLFAGLCLWGFWRWLKLKQDRQRLAGQSIEQPQPADPNMAQNRSLPTESDLVNRRQAHTQPDEQLRGWLDEIKRKLLNREKDNNDDHDG